MRSAEKKSSILSGIHLEHWRVIACCMLAYDIVAVNAAYFCALLLRFDFRYSSIPKMYLTPFYRFIPTYTIFCVIIFTLFRLYRSIWQYASYDEMIRVIEASLITAAFHIVGITMIQRMPISYYMMGSVLQFFLVLAIRFSYRFVILLRNRSRSVISTGSGAGNIMGLSKRLCEIICQAFDAKIKEGKCRQDSPAFTYT